MRTLARRNYEPPNRIPRGPAPGALYPMRYLPPDVHRLPAEHWPALTRYLDAIAKTSPEVRARVTGELDYAVTIFGGDRTGHTRSRSNKRRRKARR